MKSASLRKGLISTSNRCRAVPSPLKRVKETSYYEGTVENSEGIQHRKPRLLHEGTQREDQWNLKEDKGGQRGPKFPRVPTSAKTDYRDDDRYRCGKRRAAPVQSMVKDAK